MAVRSGRQISGEGVRFSVLTILVWILVWREEHRCHGTSSRKLSTYTAGTCRVAMRVVTERGGNDPHHDTEQYTPCLERQALMLWQVPQKAGLHREGAVKTWLIQSGLGEPDMRKNIYCNFVDLFQSDVLITGLEALLNRERGACGMRTNHNI